jgi:hypothetical protein
VCFSHNKGNSWTFQEKWCLHFLFSLWLQHVSTTSTSLSVITRWEQRTSFSLCNFLHSPVNSSLRMYKAKQHIKVKKWRKRVRCSSAQNLFIILAYRTCFPFSQFQSIHFTRPPLLIICINYACWPEFDFRHGKTFLTSLPRPDRLRGLPSLGDKATRVWSW